MTTRPKARTLTPLFVVAELDRSLAFYARLGFGDASVWGEPPCFAKINRDGLELMLSLADGEAAPRPNGHGVWDVYIAVADLDAETAALNEAGVDIDRGPTVTEYRMKEIEVVDPDGFRICLAQNVE